MTSEGTIKTCLHHNNEIPVKGKTKNEIYKNLKKALKTKEKSHQLQDNKTSDKSMNKIGG